jgi:hypothetical protein
VAIVQEKLVATGFPEAAAARIAASQRRSTIAVYDSKWNTDWCGERTLDPLNTTPPMMAAFFHEVVS